MIPHLCRTLFFATTLSLFVACQATPQASDDLLIVNGAV